MTRSLNPEAQEMLPAAVEYVTNVYIGEVIGEHFGSLIPQERDDIWRDSARMFPPFRNQIIGLKLAIDNARQTFEGTTVRLKPVIQSRFRTATDPGIQHLLTMLLCSRATLDQGIVDPMIVLDNEAEAMKIELGVAPGVSGSDLETMRLPKAIEAVLTGELRFSRVTPTTDQL